MDVGPAKTVAAAGSEIRLSGICLSYSPFGLGGIEHDVLLGLHDRQDLADEMLQMTSFSIRFEA